MTTERGTSRRWVLNSLLGGLVVGSGCVDSSDSAGAETTRRAALTTGRTSTAGTTAETTATTTTEATTTETTTTETTTETTTTVTRPVTYDGLELRDRPTLGTRNVPVTLVYWSDYQCPYCQRFEAKTLPKIEEKLIASGQLRFVYKPVPMFGKESKRVATAAHSVWNQVKDDDRDAFWNWQRDVVNAAIDDESGWTTRRSLVERADGTDGVSGDDLDSDIRSGRYGDRVEDDYTEAKDWSFEGTPHFLIFGDDPGVRTTLSGTPSYEWIADAVEMYR